jgi:hypothetical protein
MMNLETRFFDFCNRHPEAENIDDLVKTTGAVKGMKIADFFFQNRTIVCEVKTLNKETADKLVAYMRKVGLDPAHLPRGQHSIERLFLEFEEGEAKYRKAIDLITTPIADGIDDAEKQIRDTKRLFSTPAADGLLIILNDQVNLAGPPLIVQRLAQRLIKNAPDGSPYYKHINHFVHIGEKYTPSGENAFMDLTIPNWRSPETQGVAAFVGDFIQAWAAFNGQTFTNAGEQHVQLLKDSDFVINIKNRNERR